jgi:hypothetical protein
MQENGKATVGRECDRDRKIIDGTWIPGNVRKQFAVRKLDTAWRFLREQRISQGKQKHEREFRETTRAIVHGVSIWIIVTGL